MADLEHPAKITRRKAPLPWEPAKYEEADIGAMKALFSDERHKRAVEWILFNVCGLRDLSFRPGGQDGDRATVFSEGKRFVGLQMVKMTSLRVRAKPEGENG